VIGLAEAPHVTGTAYEDLPPREKEIPGKASASEICHTQVVVLEREGASAVQQVGRAGCGVCWKHNRCVLKRRT
jgi:hypothetical protein